jgi:hypothetical protein
LEVEALFEVGLREYRAGAHVHFELKEGMMLGSSPMPLFCLPGKIQEGSGNFGVVQDKVMIISSEAEELANLCRIP